MDLDAFYSEIEDMVDDIPTSSQPALAAVQAAFQESAEQGDEVLGVFLSSKMSGTFESALLAARAAVGQHPAFSCVVVDSMTNCLELGWPVIEACKARDEGASLTECARRVRESIRSTRFIFAPESLRFLAAGGRIGRASALLGSVLDITPILTVKDGVASVFTKVRSQKKALAKMSDILSADMRDYGLKNIAVHYIGSRAKAETWAKSVIEPLVGRPVMVTPASPVIGTHVGPAVGIAYECARPIKGKFSAGVQPEVVVL